MHSASGSATADAAIAGERVITEFWASPAESNASNHLASSLPLGLGLFIYAPLYVLKALRFRAMIRYTLTNRRIRVERGMTKQLVKFVLLDAIDEVKVADYLPFTRTGNIEIFGKGEVLLRMHGVQDPEPAAHTIHNAVRARIEVQKVLAQHQSVAAR